MAELRRTPPRLARAVRTARCAVDAVGAVELSQAAGRLRRLIPPAWLLAAAPVGRAPAFAPLAPGLVAELVSQSEPGRPPAETRRFTAVGVTRPFSPSPAFWTSVDDGLLFNFQLHGFAELPRALPLTPASSEFWEAVITSWLDTCERPALPAWHPHPTSIRIIAWSIALSTAPWPADLRARMIESLWRQARYLRRSIEHDIGGNHVLKNATALAIAGACFADGGLERNGLTVLARELPRQFLADGGHVERSASYHRETLNDLRQVAELRRRSGRNVPAAIDQTIARASSWLQSIVGPDGRVPLLNDAWEGPAVKVGRSVDLTVLPDSGHVVLRHARDQVLLDCGPLGPSHLPAHAHADALSFVAWFDNAPLIVDRGTFAYSGVQRNRYRATAAHNTVEIQHRDQCVFWGDFRASRLPKVELSRVWREGDAILVSAEHDGYRPCRGRPIHQRVLVWLPGDGLVVIDRVASLRRQSVRSFLHLAPTAVLEDGRVGNVSVCALGRLSVSTVPERHAPWLGSSVPAQCMIAQGTTEPAVPFGWSLLRLGAEVVALSGDAVTIRRVSGSVVEFGLKWP